MTTVALTVALGLLAMPAATAQAPAPGLVVGSGNFFSPIVANLENAIAFYRDGLGLEVTGQPSNATGNAPLRNMFGRLGLRPTARAGVLEVPGSNLVIELLVSTTGTRQVSGPIQDPGSTRLQLQVRDLDAAIQAAVRAGGRVVSTGGRPVELPGGRGNSIKAAIVQDPDNLFLVLIHAAPPTA